MFRSKPIVQGMAPFILLGNNTKLAWPLICQPGGREGEEIFTAAVTTVKKYLKTWMQSDIFYTTHTDQQFTSTLSHQIYQLSLPFLPNPQILQKLHYVLDGNAISVSGIRLIDACVQATAAIPTDAFYCIRGRFLLAMTEGLPEVAPGGATYPTKAEWVELLTTVPWIPYLQYIQNLYDTDEDFIQYRDNYYNRIAKQTTTVTDRPTHG